MNDMFWRLSIAEGSNLNCAIWDTSLQLNGVLCPAAVIDVAGLDFLNEIGVFYAEILAKHGLKEVELVEAGGVLRQLAPKTDE